VSLQTTSMVQPWLSSSFLVFPDWVKTGIWNNRGFFSCIWYNALPDRLMKSSTFRIIKKKKKSFQRLPFVSSHSVYIHQLLLFSTNMLEISLAITSASSPIDLSGRSLSFFKPIKNKPFNLSSRVTRHSIS
jgi:hypothetical protein